MKPNTQKDTNLNAALARFLELQRAGIPAASLTDAEKLQIAKYQASYEEAAAAASRYHPRFIPAEIEARAAKLDEVDTLQALDEAGRELIVYLAALGGAKDRRNRSAAEAIHYGALRLAHRHSLEAAKYLCSVFDRELERITAFAAELRTLDVEIAEAGLSARPLLSRAETAEATLRRNRESLSMFRSGLRGRSDVGKFSPQYLAALLAAPPASLPPAATVESPPPAAPVDANVEADEANEEANQ